MTESERQALEDAQNEYQRGALALQDDLKRATEPHEEAISEAKRAYSEAVEVIRLACESKKRAVHAKAVLPIWFEAELTSESKK